MLTIGEVVSTFGLDLAFIGSGDPTTSMGHRGRTEHPEVQTTMIWFETAIRPERRHKGADGIPLRLTLGQ